MSAPKRRIGRNSAAAVRRAVRVTIPKIMVAKPVHFSIPSDFASGGLVQKRIIDAVERSGYDDDSVFGIKLAVDEALINAIKHGNKLNPSKRVHVQASITPRRLEIVIEDEGRGFDRNCVPDPTCAENLEKPCGRGILLMEAYMDRVEWSRGGRRVKMVKKPELRPTT